MSEMCYLAVGNGQTIYHRRRGSMRHADGQINEVDIVVICSNGFNIGSVKAFHNNASSPVTSLDTRGKLVK